MNEITKAIQLALAPVFLLGGIAGMLSVMSGRLSRIIDRGRALTEGTSLTAYIGKESIDKELQTLERRRHFTSIAITATTVAALLICLVVVMLFIEVMFDAPLDYVVGALFTCGTLALVVGLAFYLREVLMAANTVRIHRPGPRN